MNCIDCEDMGCRVFTAKDETWTGFCMNKSSPKCHTTVTGKDGCTVPRELSLF